MRTRIALLSFLAALVVTAAAVAPASAKHARSTTFTVDLTGPGGTGTALVKLNPGGKVCYTIDVTLTTPGDVPQEPGPGVGTAHIHGPTGAIAVNLHTQFQSLGGGMFVASGCVRADKTVVRQILADPSAYYVNVHTTTYPAGAVSGPLA